MLQVFKLGIMHVVFSDVRFDNCNLHGMLSTSLFNFVSRKLNDTLCTKGKGKFSNAVIPEPFVAGYNVVLKFTNKSTTRLLIISGFSVSLFQ